MPTGSVRSIGLELNDRASRNSSQAFTKARIPAVKTPGAESGTTTLNKAPMRVQPSIMAEFSRSRGMPSKNDTRIKVQTGRSEEHTSELQSRQYLVCRLLLEKKKQNINTYSY